ncbi:hypothetical protein L6R46_08505 [Myxococcota bacterium]|nr:hypothetical protein [Myxococcota bacterium]
MSDKKNDKLPFSKPELRSGFRRLRDAVGATLSDAAATPSSSTRVSAPALLHALYAVECGLKCWLLQRGRLESTAALDKECLTHDLNKLTELVEQRLELKPYWHSESPTKLRVPVAQLHELYRYGGRLTLKDERTLAASIHRLILSIEENVP